MPLFQVPGWSVPAEPVSTSSKKRKRDVSDSTGSLLSSAVTKLKRKTVDDASVRNTDPALKRVRKKIKPSKHDTKELKRKEISRPLPLLAVDKATLIDSSSDATRRLSKKAKIRHDAPSPGTSFEAVDLTELTDSNGQEGSQLTSLQQSMKQSLDGAKFRFINESLYKSNSQSVKKMVEENPVVFDEYHTGFRRQVKSWPSNPVDHYISILSEYPPKTVVADLGCGDAALARALSLKGLNVLSYDLVSRNQLVIEADICNKLPLPGTSPNGDEKGQGGGQVIDVVVCALSLMATNWPNCVREAWRILRPNGELKIAEVTSRLKDIDAFVSLVSSIGFEFTSKNDENTHFLLFEFKKIAGSTKNWEDILSKSHVLQPCEYKRR